MIFGIVPTIVSPLIAETVGVLLPVPLKMTTCGVIMGFQIPASVGDPSSVPHTGTRLFATQCESRPATVPSVSPIAHSPEARISVPDRRGV